MMKLTLYPLIQQDISSKIENHIIDQLWQTKQNHQNIIYYIYHDFKADFEGGYKLSIATEIPQQNQFKQIDIDDLTFYEKFITDVNNINATWQMINRKTQQGLLKRSYGIDFEKHYPNGRIEIYIQTIPHC